MTFNSKNQRGARIPLLILLTALLMIPSAMGLLNPRQANATDIPEWVHNFDFKGDLRLRYQGEEENEEGDKRQRFRFRFRPAVSAQVTDKWSIDFGFASGGDDLRSTNQTFTGFKTYALNIDLAYATYKPSDTAEFFFGKMKNPIWGAKDLAWDTDIRPDGAAATFTFETSDNTSFFLTPAFFVFGDVREKNDDDLFENMMLVQGGINTKFAGDAYLKFAASAYLFNDLDIELTYAGNVNESAGTNTMNMENGFVVDAELGTTALPLFVAAFGQYQTTDADEDNTGYLVGVKFGDKSIKKLGQWQAKYSYRNQEANAWLDFLPDSDAMGGATGIEGSELEFKLGIAKNITCGIDYYMMKEKASGLKLDLLQLDLVMKF